MPSLLDSYTDQTRCWFPDKDLGWVSGHVTNKHVDGEDVRIDFVDENGKDHTVTTSLSAIASNPDVLPPLRNPPVLEGTEDLTNLSHLNEPAGASCALFRSASEWGLIGRIGRATVLHTILHRYSLRSIYTYSGIVLVAVNPFTSLSGVYSPSVVQAYSSRLKGELEPHLFAIAEEAYRCMVGKDGEGGGNQTIVVSGESGAGKTVSAKYIMRYFATVEDPNKPGKKKTTASGMTEVEEQILATNPIMEAFGNAKTTRNDNSSRFGKYIEILFDGTQTIVGARIRTYLLERSRLVYQPETERNYHIFYQLLAGAPSSERKSLGLDSASSFTYLNQGGPNALAIAGVDDAAEFEATQKALSTVGITVERQWQIFKVLAALLHLGNMEIRATRTDALLDDDDASLVRATSLLGIDKTEFKRWILKKQIVTRTDKIVTSLNAAQANVVKDSVAKHIYASLFEWLVAVINESLTNEKVEGTVKNFIGVLDIYGFEHFKKNSFEQFCINYANEKLQQEFNAHVFKLEQEEYMREQINWTFIDFADNQPTIDLIEGKLGVLSLLDEESRMPSGSDSNFVQKLHSTVGAKPENAKVFKKPRFGNNGFTISHYALDVTYEADGFLEKNRDTVPDEHLALLATTTNPFLKEVLDCAEATKVAIAEADAAKAAEAAAANPAASKRMSVMGGAGGARGGTARKPTLGSIFKASLISLMDTIDSTNAHYIRCIKPNEAKQAWEVEPPMVLGQLRACGVLETIKISCAGYPTRWKFDEFADRYYMLVPSSQWQQTSDLRALCESILSSAISEPDRYQVGLTKIFFRAGLLARFEQLRTSRLNELTTLIQKNVRRFLAMRDYSRVRKMILGVQAVVRANAAKRRAEEARREKAAVMVQKVARGFMERQRFERAKRMVVALQAIARGQHLRANFVEERKKQAATQLQSMLRGAVARQQFLRDRRRVILLQSCVRRRQARGQLKALKAEARSATHFKEVTYRLENKVVELTQTLQKRTTENRDLQSKLRALEQQLDSWQSKHDEADSRAKALQSELDKPTIALAEFEALAQQKKELDARLEESLKQIADKDAEIERIHQDFLKQKTDLEAKQGTLQKSLAAASDDSATVSGLRQELASLREQLSRQVAINNNAAKAPRQDANFTMATGQRSVAPGAPVTNGVVENGSSPSLPAGVAAAAAALSAPQGAKRRARRHSDGVMDGVSVSPIPEDGRWEKSPRPVSMAFPQEPTVRRLAGGPGGKGYLPDVYDDPAEEIMRLLEEEEPLDEDVLFSLVRHLKIPAPNLSSPPSPKEVLFPAHLISLVTNEMWKYGMMRESERFLANVMQTIQQHVMSYTGDEVIVPGIFWLSNVHEILSFVCIAESDILQGIGPGGDGIGRDYEWDDYERLVTIVKHDLDSLEYNIYHTWMQETKKRLHKMVIPALIESQSLPGFVTSDSGGRLFNRLVGGNQAPAFSMDDILNLLNKVWKSLKSYYVEVTVVQQAITELLKLIGVTSFNDLLMRRNFSSWKRAMQIQYNITRLEEWCKAHDMPEGTLQLEHLMQATKLLQLKKASLADIEIIFDVCWMLTPTQIQKLVANYYVADYENPISPEILRAVNARVVAGDKNDHLLLPPEVEEAGQYETPLPREVTGIETYIPSYLVAPHIRRLRTRAALQSPIALHSYPRPPSAPIAPVHTPLHRMPVPSVTVGPVPLAKVATGLMRLTWAPKHTPDEQAFELMKMAIDEGSTTFNSGYFYGTPPDITANLKLISRFCEKYPDYKDKFFLSVKGGITPQMKPNADVDFLRKQVTEVNEILKHRKMDLFEIARVDKEAGPEKSMQNLLTLRDEGHFKYIGISEASADTIRRSAAVGPVAAVELEYSPFATEIEKNGVLDACKELGIPIAAYSPLGAGFLGNNWKSKDDIPEGDMRRNFDKFSDEHFEHNMELVRKLTSIAEKKGVTPAQLSIAWVGAQWAGISVLPGSTNPQRAKQCLEAADITFTPDELAEIRKVVDSFEVKGVRYMKNEHVQNSLFG
ncbi:Myosin-2A [Rhodotorula toruloides]|nr:Myosin-2A [Rhodotorula toruloides]